MMNNIDGLITEGVIQIGKNATDNPSSINGYKSFALGIANKDYPAKTPMLWNETFRELDLTERNIRTYGDPANAERIFNVLRSDDRYIGGDVGVGFKDQILEFLDEVEPLSQIMGAVNVVVKTDNGLTGYNTDGIGYTASLENALKSQNRELEDSNIMLLGAGGTTNAIAFALAGRGAGLTILNRTASKAEELAYRINDYFDGDLAQGGGREDIPHHLGKVNAVVSIIDDPSSPLDQYSALGSISLPITDEAIASNLAEARNLLENIASRDLIVSDVLLRQNDTTTIALAKEMGFATLDGIPMVINQAIEAFWLVNAKQLSARNITYEQVAKLMRQ